MSDYLNSLVARALHLSPVVQPRLASLFEPLSSASGPETAAPVETHSMLADSQSTELGPEASTIRLPTEAGQRVSQMAVEPSDGPMDRTTAGPEDGGGVNQPLNPFNLPPPMRRSAPLPSQVVPQSPISPPDLETTRVLTVEARGPVHEEGPPHYSNTDAMNSSSEAENNHTRLRIAPEVRRRLPAKDPQPLKPTLITQKPQSVPFHDAAKQAILPAGRVSSQASVPTSVPETVVVTIGRVDVRAVFATPVAAPRSNRPQQPGPMSLDEYIKQRSEGLR